jgi:hypothetical protein
MPSEAAPLPICPAGLPLHSINNNVLDNLADIDFICAQPPQRFLALSVLLIFHGTSYPFL